jgi:hypothetical protein
MDFMNLKVFVRLQEFIKDLSTLHHLRTINIRTVGWTRYPYDRAEATEWLGWAKKILSRVAQNSKDNQEPRKVVMHLDEVPETHFVHRPEEP